MLLSVTLLWICAPGANAQQGKRVALVIGNDAYSLRPLENAVNDARAIQRALTGSGFRVVMRENASRAAMEEAAVEFFGALAPGDTALFYFAGHAVQIESENVLIPTDFQSARNVIEAKIRSFSLNSIFDYLKRSRARTMIVIIDACRSNPVAERYSLQGGLATPLEAGKGTYIAYSTSPNKVATDNPNGHNSWFTEALADAIAQPGLTLDDVFTRVRLRVESATGGMQTPWSYTSLTSKFYFHPPEGIQSETDESAVEKWWSDARRNEQYGNWEEALDLAGRVVKQKAGGPAEEAAKRRLPYLEARNGARAKFEAGDFRAAAESSVKALELEPFAIDAAFEAANAALLAEDLPAAVRALEAARRRGTTAAARKAETILKELGHVEPSAESALKSGIPKPPPIEEVFALRFGEPDWDAGKRRARQTEAMDFAAVAKDIPPPPAMPPPPPPASAELAQANAPVSLDELHVEVKAARSVSRDFEIEDFGTLTIASSRKEMTVLMNGRPISQSLPFTIKVPPGEYDVRTIEGGKTLTERRVKVESGVASELVLK